MTKEVYDVIYLSDKELGIPSDKGKNDRPCIIISIDYEGGPMNYVVPLTSQSKYWDEDDSKYFLQSLGSYVDTESKPIKLSYSQIIYAELSDELNLDDEDIDFIKMNF